MARKPFPLMLNERERRNLRRLAKKAKTSAAAVLRALLERASR